MGRPRHATLDDLPVTVHRVIGDERRLPREALKRQDTNTPPVSPEPMALIEDDLRSEIFGRATESPCAVLPN